MLEQLPATPVITKVEGRKKKDDIPEEERILRESRAKQQLITKERMRIDYFRIRHEAAVRIQKAWKMYKFRAKGLMKNARESVRQKRLDAGELEWKRQIAACTIQLAWRKYYRRRLLESLNLGGRREGSGCARKRMLHLWDPAVVAAKQRTIMEQIYREHLYAPDWHPQQQATARPLYMREAGSPAALSFNFAYEQYYPATWYEAIAAEETASRGLPDMLHSPTLLTEDVDFLEADIQSGIASLVEGLGKLGGVRRRLSVSSRNSFH